MAVVDIPRAEVGSIRVFAISRPMATMARLLKQQSKATLASSLLAHDVSDDDFELFALSDLTGVGLPGYLSDGYGVDKDAIRADRGRLEALDGYVLLLFSRVTRGADITLTPHTDLTLIGTYAEPKAAHTAPPIATEAAKPYSGPQTRSIAPKRSRVRSALTAVSAVLTLILIWWILR